MSGLTPLEYKLNIMTEEKKSTANEIALGSRAEDTTVSENEHAVTASPVANGEICKDTGIEDVESTTETVAETGEDTLTLCLRVKKQLADGEEVQLVEFMSAGLRFADMPASLQRAETKKNVSDLEKSLVRAKCFYHPIEVKPAKDFIEAGLGTPLRLDGTPINIDDEDIDTLYVRPDGKQRSCAAANYFSKKSNIGKENEFDIRVKMCPAPIAELPTYIREIQTASVWDEKTKRKTTVACFDKEESGLTLMNEIIESTGMSARGAFKIINRRDGYRKSLYEDSVSSGILHKDFNASPEVLERAKHDCEVMKIAFRSKPKYLKNSAAVDALIEVYTRATVNQNEAVEEYQKFLMSLGDDDFIKLDNEKSVDGKKALFLQLLDEFKKKLLADSSFIKEVEVRIETAKREYSFVDKDVRSSATNVSHEASYFLGGHEVKVAGRETKIEWTDKTWNPATGCTKHSEGCANCYAERDCKRLQAMGRTKYANGFKLTLHPEALKEPYTWKKPCKVFVCSMGDLFHKDVPKDFIDKVLKVIEDNPQHTFQMLTKREKNMAAYFKGRAVPSNLWVGVTVENADVKHRIDCLREVPTSNRFLSIEPLLGELGDLDLTGINWIIVGGESGKNARPMAETWVLDIKRQADANGIPFFFKQWGAWGRDGVKRSVKANGKLLQGKIVQNMPKDDITE